MKKKNLKKLSLVRSSVAILDNKKSIVGGNTGQTICLRCTPDPDVPLTGRCENLVTLQITACVPCVTTVPEGQG